jgi:hypothetical protein
MAAGLEERIGGNLPASVIHHLYELRVDLAFQILEVDEEEIIWKCLDAWLEVRRHCYELSESSRETDDEIGC